MRWYKTRRGRRSHLSSVHTKQQGTDGCRFIPYAREIEARWEVFVCVCLTQNEKGVCLFERVVCLFEGERKPIEHSMCLGRECDIQRQRDRATGEAGMFLSLHYSLVSPVQPGSDVLFDVFHAVVGEVTNQNLSPQV